MGHGAWGMGNGAWSMGYGMSRMIEDRTKNMLKVNYVKGI
jgi:hypothetical protein